jgi:hypothetical protein
MTGSTIGAAAFTWAASGAGSSLVSEIFAFRVLGFATSAIASVSMVVVLLVRLRVVFGLSATDAASMAPATASGSGFFLGRPLFFGTTSVVDIMAVF